MTKGPDWTPVLSEGSIGVRFKQEGDKLLREQIQPDHNLIHELVQDERRSGIKQRGFGGWKVATLSLVDLERAKKDYPGLFDARSNKEERLNTLKRFCRDPKYAHCQVAKP